MKKVIMDVDTGADVPVHPGADRPLMKEPAHVHHIHGEYEANEDCPKNLSTSSLDS